MQNINFKIQTLNDLQEARDLKINLEKEIEQNFRRACSIGTINLTRDIVGNVIPNKINKLIDQLNNPLIIDAENAKKSITDEANKEIVLLKKEQKSILAIITSNLKFKKLVTNIELAESNSHKKYVASVGEENSSSSFKQVLEDEKDVELAKRFIEIGELIFQQDNKIQIALEAFNEKIKDLEYVEDHFYEEFNELEKISKFYFHSNNLEFLEVDDVYLFYGNEVDFEFYKECFIKIKDLYKKYKDLKKEKSI